MRRSSPISKRHCARSIGMREEAARPAELDAVRRNEMGFRRGIGRVLGLGIAALIRAYQLIVAPILPPSCRFYPSCSYYAAEAVELHGPWRGLVLALRRLLRCHPWGGSGYDPVPPVPSR
jgi:putative membrane protein insertion efficiency factor